MSEEIRILIWVGLVLFVLCPLALAMAAWVGNPGNKEVINVPMSKKVIMICAVLSIIITYFLITAFSFNLLK